MSQPIFSPPFFPVARVAFEDMCTIGPEGGEFKFWGVDLLVPANALDAPENCSVIQTSDRGAWQWDLLGMDVYITQVCNRVTQRMPLRFLCFMDSLVKS